MRNKAEIDFDIDAQQMNRALALLVQTAEINFDSACKRLGFGGNDTPAYYESREAWVELVAARQLQAIAKDAGDL